MGGEWRWTGRRFPLGKTDKQAQEVKSALARTSVALVTLAQALEALEVERQALTHLKAAE